MSSSPAGAKPEKTMSSRLLTMKFMQRAAATAVAKESQSGSENGPPTPKRARLSTEAQSPGTPGTPQAELDAINAALKAEEDKRRAAAARQAAEAGETEWVLDIPTASYPSQPMVVAADSLDTEGDTPRGGRRSFGNFKRKPKYAYTGEDDEEMNDEEKEELKQIDPEDSDQMDAFMEKLRANAQARALKRNNTHNFKLSELTSISGGGGRQPQMGRPSSEKKTKNKKKRKSG
ncbi:uncharacterized protein N7477_007278 [Penicillium maclennaniae]|uniref:uncharacterized protein n=1 Tax=Penicillium maclennaniae TaxID=1343394 RepID=UPI0025418F11|nr:uncharacterized protein N7477_007278 [Penicillium maclennaniae]KAJ5664830.1 hypothetical protein N7477_007278 [Penicillium maclennaniae]